MIQTTQEELELLCARFFPVFQEYVRRKSVATGDIELAVSLDGINSLPAVYELGGVQKTVRVPMKLLTRDVDAVISSCNVATKEAQSATADCIASTKKVNDAILDISKEKQAALDAATSANTAKSNADTARIRIEGKEAEWANAESARVAAETIRVTSENARISEETKRSVAETIRVTSENARQNAETIRQSAETKRQSDMSKAISDCNTATASANRVKNDCQDVTSRCESTNSTAEEKIVVMESLMKSFSGEANAAPVLLEVSAPSTVSTRNKMPQRITARLLPVYVMQNVLFQRTDGVSLLADPSGNLRVKGIGTTTFYIIPPGNTELWKEISVTVRQPHMRLTSSGKIRRSTSIRIV